MKQNLLLVLVLCFFHSSSQVNPELKFADKVRIREAMIISEKFGDRLFKGFSSIPFPILLVTDSVEFLINHPYPSPDFKSLGQDNFLNKNVVYRKANFDKHLLATFPAVNGLSCVVVGTPENTNKNSTDWVTTLLHEHFHQYQNTDSNYFKAIDQLDLSAGDQTGMWMLNYLFPYDSLPIIKQYKLFSTALCQALKSVNTKQNVYHLQEYIKERKKFKAMLSPADYRYFSFQVWQEGLARNTEYEFLKMLINYTPSKEMLNLPDFISFSSHKKKMYQDEIANLLSGDLNKMRRVSFYSIGFAEGLMLNTLNKNWRKRYLLEKFYIENYSHKYN